MQPNSRVSKCSSLRDFFKPPASTHTLGNSFAGDIVIKEGTIGTGTAQGGGTFRYAPVAQTLTLSGNTNIQLDGTLTFDAIGNISVAGASAILEGTGGLGKTGDGTLELAATKDSLETSVA